MSIYTTYSDKELIDFLKTEDQANHAFAEIYDRYFSMLQRHALQKIRNRDDANDILHELFLSLWINRKTLAITNSLSAYLYASIRKMIMRFLIRGNFINDYIESIQEYIQRAVPVTEHDVLLTELHTTIEKEVLKMPRKMREIFELSRFQEMSHKEIAETLQTTESNVKKQIHNALKILRPKLLAVITMVPFF